MEKSALIGNDEKRREGVNTLTTVQLRKNSIPS